MSTAKKLCRKIDDNNLLPPISGMLLTRTFQYLVWFVKFATYMDRSHLQGDK